MGPVCGTLQSSHAPVRPGAGSVQARTERLESPTFFREPAAMSICHEHNLAQPLNPDHTFGIRVRLRSNDPFKHLVGSDWTREHWYASAAERDDALEQMSKRYDYFRPGDTPALAFEKLEK
jgi:hypothetical protein